MMRMIHLFRNLFVIVLSAFLGIASILSASALDEEAAEETAVANIYTNENEVLLKPYEGKQLSYYLEPEGSTEIPVWYESEDDCNCIEVNETGYVTASGNCGTAYVRAEMPSGSAVAYTIYVCYDPYNIYCDSISVLLEVDETETLSIYTDPYESRNCAKHIVSNDTGVVEVEQDSIYSDTFRIRAVGEGETTVDILTVNELCYSVDVTVKNGIADYISTNDSATYYLETGETVPLSYYLEPKTATEKPVWAVKSGSEYADVDQDGNVTAKSPGMAVIEATIFNGSSMTYTVNVADRATEMKFTVEEISVHKGGVVNLRDYLEFTPSTARSGFLTLSSEDYTIARTEASYTAYVYGVSAGTTVVHVKDKHGLERYVNVVVDANADRIYSNDSATYYLETGETKTLNYLLEPAVAEEKPVWSVTSGSEYADVDQDGNVVAKSPGMAVITATIANGNSLAYTINVADKADDIRFTVDEISVPKGGKVNLRDYLEITPDTANMTFLTCSSDDYSIARTEASYTSYVYGMSAGETKVHVQDKYGTGATVTVKVFNDKADYIYVNGPTDYYLEPGQTQKLPYCLEPADALEKPVWSMSGPGSSVASVDENGLVTAKNPGTAYMQARISSGSTVYYTVFVSEKATKIEFSTDEILVPYMGTVNLRKYLKIEPDGASNCQLTCSSDDYSIASTNSSYDTYVFGAGIGTTTVYVTDNHGLSDSVTVTVTDKLADYIYTNDSTTYYVKLNEKVQLNYLLSPSEAQEKPVWSAGNYSSYVDVDENGLVTAKKAGRAYVTATIANGRELRYTLNIAEEAREIKFTKDELLLLPGQQVNLRNYLKFKPMNAQYCFLTCSSKDYTIARTEASYTTYCYAGNPGTTTVTVTNGDGQSAEVKVTVLGGYATSINAVQSSFFIDKDDTVKLEYTMSGDSDCVNEKVSWIVKEGADIVDIDQEGNVKALKYGEAKIWAVSALYGVTLDGFGPGALYAEYTISVSAEPSGIHFTQDEYYITKGSHGRIYAASDTPEAEYCERTYSSSDTTILKASENGNVYGRGTGTVTLTCTTATGKTAQTIVHVTEAESHNIYRYHDTDVDFASLNIGETKDVKEKLLFSPSRVDDSKLNWESENEGIVTVDGGVITGVAAGHTYVHITEEGSSSYNGTIEVYVNDKLTSFGFEKTEYYMEEGTELNLRTLLGFAPADAIFQDVTFTSGDESAVGVYKQGTYWGARANSEGTAVITAEKSTGETSQITIHVQDPKQAVSIELAESEPFTVHLNHIRMPKLRIGPAEADQYAYTLTSSDPSVAEITTDYKTGRQSVQGVSAGTAKVTAALKSDPSVSVIFDVKVISGNPQTYRYRESLSEINPDNSVLRRWDDRSEYTCYVGRIYSFYAQTLRTTVDSLEYPANIPYLAEHTEDNCCIREVFEGLGAAGGLSSFEYDSIGLPFVCVHEGTVKIRSLGDRTVTIHCVKAPEEELEVLADEIINADEPTEAATFAGDTEKISQTISKAIEEGETLTVELEHEKLAEVDTQEKDLIVKTAGADQNTVIDCYDISLLLKKEVTSETTETVAEITATKAPITVQLPLSEEAKANGEQFKVIRIHDGVAEELESTLSADGDYIIFKTDRFSTYAVVYQPKADAINIYGATLELQAKIGINFYLEMPENDLEKKSVIMTVGEKETVINGRDGRKSVQNGKTYMVYTCPVTSKEMRDVVSLSVKDDKNNIIKLKKNDGELVEEISYSAAQYYASALSGSDDGLKDLVKVMDTYGKYAQLFFKYNVDEEVKQVDDISDITAETVNDYHAEVEEAEVEGISFIGVTTRLSDAIAYRAYFTVKEGYDIGDYTFTIKGNPVIPVKNGEYYYIEKADIAARELGTMDMIEVSRQAESKKIRMSALSYVYAVLNDESTDIRLKNVCRAMYLYHQAAITYFGNSEN